MSEILIIENMSEIRLTIRGVIFALFPQYDKTNPDTAKLVREVAIVLIDGHYVNIPCAGGALSVVRLAGMVARRMRRTRTSDSAAGYKQPRL